MVDFITERLSSYYERRLLDYANNRRPRLLTKYPDYEGQCITLISEDVYEVASSREADLYYTVNVAACMCTCYEGCTGKACKHMHYVRTVLDLDCSRSYHLADQRERMYYVACGKASPPGWLDTLHGQAQVEHAFHDTNVTVSRSNAVETAMNTDMVTDDTQICQQLEARQAEFLAMWRAKIDCYGQRNAAELVAAYDVAIKTLSGVTTANAAISVVHTLGKYSEGGSCKRRKMGNIPVQTTAIARRRKSLRGRAPGEPGRPRKLTVLSDNKHSYTMPSRRHGVAAAHNLSLCVRKNSALGRTHSKK